MLELDQQVIMDTTNETSSSVAIFITTFHMMYQLVCVYRILIIISYYHTGIDDLIIEILEDRVIIKWTPLNYTELTSYILEYKQTNEQIFRNVTFLISVVSIGLPTLQHGIEYVFQVYGVSTINNVEYENERSPPVTIMISSSTTSSNDSQTGSTGLVAGISVLSIIIIIISIIINIILVVLLFIEKNKNNTREMQKFVKDILIIENIFI